MKKVLVVGGGAREHALCDAVYRSQDASLFSVMKNVNPGIKHVAEDYKQIKETDVEQVVNYAK
ncbi:MAG: phosphoribosylamine--glycine ligase, partial [Candidatus Thermoplasmatota archaeon]|nr:phosphoribosylamine--glycine ligase [Candidatus Thermoplasmatota archaeon]